ncbi:MAG: hypothetical protein QW103_02640 [Candidatus Pacearchaeota archaeon]
MKMGNFIWVEDNTYRIDIEIKDFEKEFGGSILDFFDQVKKKFELPNGKYFLIIIDKTNKILKVKLTNKGSNIIVEEILENTKINEGKKYNSFSTPIECINGEPHSFVVLKREGYMDGIVFRGDVVYECKKCGVIYEEIGNYD